MNAENATTADVPQDAPALENDFQAQLDQMRTQMESLTAENTKLSASLQKKMSEDAVKSGKYGRELQLRDKQIQDLQLQLIGQINTKLSPQAKPEMPNYRVPDPIKDENFSGNLSQTLAERELALRNEMEQRFQAQSEAYKREVEQLKEQFGGELTRVQLASRVEREKEGLKAKGFTVDEIEEALQFGIEHNMPSLGSAAFELFGVDRFVQKSTPDPLPRANGANPQKIAQEVARQKPQPTPNGGAHKPQVSTAIEDTVREWNDIFQRGDAGKLTPEQFSKYMDAARQYADLNGSATAYYR